MARPKKNLQKKTLNFNDGDWDKLAEMFPEQGPSVAVRKIISRFVQEHYVPTQVESNPDLDIDL